MNMHGHVKKNLDDYIPFKGVVVFFQPIYYGGDFSRELSSFDSKYIGMGNMMSQ